MGGGVLVLVAQATPEGRAFGVAVYNSALREIAVFQWTDGKAEYQVCRCGLAQAGQVATVSKCSGPQLPAWAHQRQMPS